MHAMPALLKPTRPSLSRRRARCGLNCISFKNAEQQHLCSNRLRLCVQLAVIGPFLSAFNSRLPPLPPPGVHSPIPKCRCFLLVIWVGVHDGRKLEPVVVVIVIAAAAAAVPA